MWVHVQQDGSVLQTVVAGSGAIQNIVWIPDVGVAVCSNRSKVGLPNCFLLFHSSIYLFFSPLHLCIFVSVCLVGLISRMCSL